MQHDEYIQFPPSLAAEPWIGGLPQEIHARERMLELRQEAAVRRLRTRGRPNRATRPWTSLWPLPVLRDLRATRLGIGEG
jgi:hypothetical protein